ncbi:hypothetical protein GCWU000325_01222 [Alloprevotella tannerae ATCC 51259]|uniref:Uncharacterized protein n=1 Tax=Alloprevotella tannerae ATCC 51259 TaxID=626522 RepID=C9LG81_9BACT|nr:hypothetical protein GCWU000325_01222 [Alloprevotella tannerae ATCC 51259]
MKGQRRRQSWARNIKKVRLERSRRKRQNNRKGDKKKGDVIQKLDRSTSNMMSKTPMAQSKN